MGGTQHIELVDDGGTTYEQGAMAIVAVALVAFLLAAGTLFGWVPTEGEVAGIPVAPAFGVVVIALGVATGVLGGLSRWGTVRTTPNRTPGPVVAFVQTILWILAVGLVATNTLGFGRLGWLAAILAGLVAGYLTISVPEDVGATIPAAIFVCILGGVIATGIITPEWTWEPGGFDATIPGTLVIPLLTILGALLTSWSAASAHERFGARGRQNGAYLLISLVVLLVLSVLVFLLVFVFQRGITVILKNLVVGAGTLILATLTALVLVLRSGTINPAAADGSAKTFAFVQLAVALALGLVAAGLAVMTAMGQSISGYSATIAATVAIDPIPGIAIGLVLLEVLPTTVSDWAPAEGRVADRAWTALGLGIRALLVLSVIQVVLWTELAVAGLAVIPTLVMALSAIAAVGLIANAATLALDRELAWLPPASPVLAVGLWSLIISSLNVLVSGNSLLFGSMEVISRGTIDWPFVMNVSQGLGIQTGVMPAMFGTIWIVLGAVVFAVPLAVGAAVFLTEYAEDSIFTSAVDIATNGLWSTPSIVFGLFGLAFLVPRFGGTPSIFSTQLVLGFMLLPLVLITSRESMKSVPDEYRDASAALGVSKWDTIRSVVIPAAMPGVITGVILGVGRIAGETAPLLLVLNGPNFPTSGPGILAGFTVEFGMQPPFVDVSNPALLERASALPYQLYAIITAGVGAEESFGWGTALVLLGVVLAFFAMGIASRRYFRRKLHQ